MGLRMKKGKASESQAAEVSKGVGGVPVAVMVFVSGFAGLVYQVLWMKQLGLLFGNTAHAASATLAAFFIGLGAGSWWWGRRVGASARPLRLYARLEFGIALAAVLYFALLVGFESLYPWLYRSLGGTGVGMLVAKLGLALLLVFPAAFFMGGTVPAIGQVAIQERSRFGRTAALLYGINTLGAALGVGAAAFVCIPAMGVRMTYGMAVLLSMSVGVMAWKLSVREKEGESQVAVNTDEEKNEEVSGCDRWALAALCFISGFVVLALEVVWTRIFAQVHENSVYSFAIILMVVLIGLAVGAGISSVLSRVVRRPMLALAGMTVVGGVFLVFGPTMLMGVTGGMESGQAPDAWADYVRRMFKMGFGGVGYTVIVLGTVFPFLMKVAEREMKVAGRMLGRLLAINTLGAIVGSLICGFVMLPCLGMWRSLQVLTAMYLVVGVLLPVGWKGVALICRGGGMLALLLLFTALNPSDLPVMGVPPDKKKVKILEAWEESDCTVTVVEKRGGNRSIVVNTSYSLGSTAAYVEQANQSRIPLMLFPETESICYIGLGTGMSAGAALNQKEFPNVKRVVGCELSPSVVAAAKKWMPSEATGGLFSDPRAMILAEDGRHFLMATDEVFDMINADLFLPYRRGAGSLYSIDHYRHVADRLNPGGVFVQWLPLYQVTDFEFGVIAKTMCQVFEEVTMWRNNFAPGSEKVALIGRMKSAPVRMFSIEDRDAMRKAVQGLQVEGTVPDMVLVENGSMPFFYAGNLSQARELFQEYPINTDDRPVIEYETPKVFREVAKKDRVIWCVGPNLTRWIERVLEVSPLENDPVWAGHPPSSFHLARAGVAFHQSMVNKVLQNYAGVQKNWKLFKSEWQAAAKESRVAE